MSVKAENTIPTQLWFKHFSNKFVNDYCGNLTYCLQEKSCQRLTRTNLTQCFYKSGIKTQRIKEGLFALRLGQKMGICTGKQLIKDLEKRKSKCLD